VVALRDPARDLEIHALVLERLGIDQPIDDFAPLRARIGVADPGFGEAALQPREVLVEPEGHARVHRHELVDPVAEDEAAVEDRDFRLFERRNLPFRKTMLAPLLDP
jgi:hypothetical protein